MDVRETDMQQQKLLILRFMDRGGQQVDFCFLVE